MKKYKVNRTNGPDLPSAETIAKYKNFGQLSHEYDKLVKRPKVPIYRDKKMFLILLLIVLVAFLLSQIRDEEVDKNATDPSQTEQSDR